MADCEVVGLPQEACQTTAEKTTPLTKSAVVLFAAHKERIFYKNKKVGLYTLTILLHPDILFHIRVEASIRLQ